MFQMRKNVAKILAAGAKASERIAAGRARATAKKATIQARQAAKALRPKSATLPPAASATERLARLHANAKRYRQRHLAQERDRNDRWRRDCREKRAASSKRGRKATRRTG